MRDKSITERDRLGHMMEAIIRIEAFVKTHTRDSFLKDDLVISATLFQFAIIGEAIHYIDRKFLDRYKYPWYKVRSFRNFILHEYHAISLKKWFG
jgi:uncharacterized protein with HEPN domain